MIGDLDTALRNLEARISQNMPGCTFWFGDTDEKMRAKSAPYVAWYVNGAQEAPPWEQPATTHFAMVDDEVEITARIAGLVESGVLGPDPRRQQHEASRTLLNWVRWAVHSLHQGKDNPLRTWTTAGPDLSDAYQAIDYHFSIRAGLMTPDQPDVQPLTQDITEVLT